MKFFLALLLFTTPLFATINGDGDSQLWILTDVKIPVSKQSRFYFDVEERWGDDMQKLWLFYVQLLYGHDFGKHIEIDGGYRQSYVLNRERRWEPIYIPLGDLKLKFDLGGFKFLNRNRVMYFALDWRPDLWVYRNLTNITFPLQLGKMKLTPIFTEEVWFVEGRGFFENRLGGGAKFNLTDKLVFQPLYIRRRIKLLNTWRNTNIWYNFLFLKF